MNEMQIYENSQFGSIRVIDQGGEPWFVAADVCRALELEDVGRAMSRLDEDEGTRIEIAHPQSPTKTMQVNAVNEPGLYSLVLGSRKPEAKAFKRWITHEVVSAIQKHGAYMTPVAAEAVLSDPDTMIRLLQEIKAKRKQIGAGRV